MLVLPSHFLNLLSKPYGPDKKSLFLHFHGALSSLHDNRFCQELPVYVEHRHVGNYNKHIGVFYHSGHPCLLKYIKFSTSSFSFQFWNFPIFSQFGWESVTFNRRNYVVMIGKVY